MLNSLLIVACFGLGLMLRLTMELPDILLRPELGTWALYLLMTLVGALVGLDRTSWATLRRTGMRMLAVPAAIVVGTGAGTLGVAQVLDLPFSQSLAVGFGFGYYSLSSLLIGKWVGAELAVIALLSNVIREILTLLLSPWLVRAFGPLGPVASGGATAMDTTLPIIARSSGRPYVPFAVLSGAALTVLVPYLVSLALML